MDSKEIRQKFLDFFEQKEHKVIPSSSLIPEDDSSVLFTTAGMHPLVPYLVGEKHPLGKRLTDVQKCVRTDDIDEVGDGFHHTFFEMLGHWSLGDYFKKEAIEWNFEFFTSSEWMGIPLEKLSVSVFAGDDDAPRDDESADIWKNLGVLEEKIFYLSKKENWWGPVGETGPCGPDSEIFYEFDIPRCNEKCDPSCQCGKYSELGNIVFMQYNRKDNGTYEELAQKNIDTGLGLERISAVLSDNKNDDYKLELFWPTIEKLENISGKKYEDNIKSFRIIADHIRAATFILGDEKGIPPSNVDQGYIIRRLIRRSIRQGKILGIEKNFTKEIAEICIDILGDLYTKLKQNKDFILSEMEKEENNFKKTLEKGLSQFEKISGKDISGMDAFTLFSTYGFPLEMTQELAEEKGISVDEESFKKEFEKHQELSRTASIGMFKGGLADSSEQSAKLHTATHLLLAALRQVLGDHVVQKGSNITTERLRFDFSHSEKMTDEQKQEVENIVNEKIKENIEITCEEMTPQEAKEKGAEGAFEHKYGDKVKVYTIQDFSREICMGPHVKNTNELGKFKIKKESASSAGIRRIKGVII